jgi:hypothetical protein
MMKLLKTYEIQIEFHGKYRTDMDQIKYVRNLVVQASPQ